MNRHLVLLSNAFYALAALLGIPALAGALFFGWNVVQLHMLAPKPPAAAVSTKTPDTVVDLIQTTAGAVGSILGFLGGIADAIMIALTIVSVCILIFAVLIGFTARGIRFRRTWARWLAFALMLWMGFVSVVITLSAGIGTAGMCGLLLAFGSGYAIWVLLRCFGMPVPSSAPAYPQPTPYPPQ